jgi:putative ABC transport system ATP-binding protein
MSDAGRTHLRKTTVAFVFQKFNLLPTLSARDNIAIARNISGRDNHFDSKFQDLLELLGIAHRLDHKPSELSGGEQQRVAIARALLREPRLVLADEPTGNLDTATGADVVALLAGLASARGTTVVVATHDESLAAMAPRRVTVRDGRVGEAVAPADVVAAEA